MNSFRLEIERLLPTLRQIARALVDDHRADVADDLVHEALDEALRNERSWSIGDLDVKLFARLITANRARLHGTVAERRSLQAGWSGEAPAATRSPASPPATAGCGLGALPVAEREVLLLAVLGKLDYARGAEVLGIPADCYVARLVRARQALGTTLWSQAGPPRAPAPRPSHLRLIKR